MEAQIQGAPAPLPRSRLVVGAVTFTGILAAGLLGGYVAGSQGGAAAGGGHGAGPEGEEGHEGHDHGPGAAHLSPRTLANLGVEIGEAALSEHVIERSVPARVAPRPGAERRLASPVAGTVLRLHAPPEGVVAPGAPVADVLRGSFPPPALALTAPILEPLNEDHHEAAVGVRRAALALSQALAEQQRLAAAEGGAPVAGRVVRDAAALVERARLELDGARHEAERHGIPPERIADLEAGRGEVEVPDVPDVRRVLLRNRLWSEDADALLALLPGPLQGLPHTLAVLGELAGSGRLSAGLVEAARRSPALAAHFLEVAGLLQQGATPAALLALAEAGALEPVVTVRAPEGAAAGWDVLALEVQPGQALEAGASLVRLRDDREIDLVLAPAPSDLPALAAALASGESLAAEPLIPSACAALGSVRLIALTGGGDGAPPGARARVENVELCGASAGRGVRTWELRPGLDYVVRVPVERRPQRFVLPADAIAYRGAQALVLLPDGDAFRPVPVRLEHHDARVAVVAADGVLFPGTRVVVRGAPALALALLAGEGGGGGHGHAHPH